MVYNTEKKAKLLTFLKENAEKSYTVEEICEKILENGHGKSTVYRLVSRLCEDGVLRKILDESTGKISYGYLDCPRCHSDLHLKCRECGQLIHVDDKAFHAFEGSLFKSSGFIIDRGALIFGVCEACCEVRK